MWRSLVVVSRNRSRSVVFNLYSTTDISACLQQNKNTDSGPKDQSLTMGGEQRKRQDRKGKGNKWRMWADAIICTWTVIRGKSSGLSKDLSFDIMILEHIYHGYQSQSSIWSMYWVSIKVKSLFQAFQMKYSYHLASPQLICDNLPFFVSLPPLQSQCPFCIFFCGP